MTSASTAPDPMIVSHSFPPIPGKVAERIRGRKFVEMKELMPDNAALRTQWAESGFSSSSLRLREFDDPLSWAFYFLGFLAVLSTDKTAKELAAYGQSIIHLAQRHGGRGWQAYDRLFRQQVAAGSPLPWNELSPSLLASTVFAGSSNRGSSSCQLCNGADHSQAACALQAGLVGSGGSADSPAKRAKSLEACRRFNKGECRLSQDACKFSHSCLACGAPHPISACSKFKMGQLILK